MQSLSSAQPWMQASAVSAVVPSDRTVTDVMYVLFYRGGRAGLAEEAAGKGNLDAARTRGLAGAGAGLGVVGRRRWAQCSQEPLACGACSAGAAHQQARKWPSGGASPFCKLLTVNVKSEMLVVCSIGGGQSKAEISGGARRRGPDASCSTSSCAMCIFRKAAP